MKMIGSYLAFLTLLLAGLLPAITAQALDILALSGEPAPGTTGKFDRFYSEVSNDAGQTAFHGDLTGPDINNGNDSGIWSDSSGSLALIARGGDDVPGTNYKILAFKGSNLAINHAGQTAFRATLTSPAGEAGSLWSEGNGTLRLVAQSDDKAPGTKANFQGSIPQRG